MTEPTTPRANALIKDVRETLRQYDEGAVFSTEACIHILVTLANWEKELCDENDALHKFYNERLASAAVEIETVCEHGYASGCRACDPDGPRP